MFELEYCSNPEIGELHSSGIKFDYQYDVEFDSKLKTLDKFLFLVDMHTIIDSCAKDFLEITIDDFDEFYMQNIIPDKDKFFKWFQNYNMYDYCYLIEDVYEVLEKLSKEYEIFIGTSYIIPEILDETSFLLPQKYDFLRKTLPFINPHNFIFLGNKSVLNCDIKIDDRLDNLDGAKTKILFTAFHNKKISEKKLKKQGIKRVNNWKEIEQLLLKEGVTTK